MEKPGRSVWLQGLLCGVIAAVLPATALLLAILLAPSGLIALAVDRSPTRAATRTMLLMGLIVAAHGVKQLWFSGNNVSASLDIAANLRMTASAWAAQGLGWLLAELAPVAAQIALDAKARGRVARLQRQRAEYEAEWSLPPNGHDQTMTP